MPRQDDFPQSVKDALARRVRYLCSNPDCGQATVGPAPSDIGKAVNIGVAAHITAASAGGPRYDPALSSDDRQSAANGIWCCQNCAKLIDNDPKSFPVELLRKWKSQAEEQAFLNVSSRKLAGSLNGFTFSWTSHQELFSSHCLRIVFCFINEGTEPIREYAATLYLPAPVAKHLRYHNSDDLVRDEVLSFNGPLLWDQAASYSVQSPLNGQVHTVIPPAKVLDNPLLPAGHAIPVAEIDFGFSSNKDTFLSQVMPYPIEADFWAGARKKVSLRLLKMADNTVSYVEDNQFELGKQSFDAKRIQKIVEDLEAQLVLPGQTRGIVKSSKRLVDAAAAVFLERGWLPEQIHTWPADDLRLIVEELNSPSAQYYLEVITD